MTEPSDLGFSYTTRKNGEVRVLHRGRLAITLRGRDTAHFLAAAADAASHGAQHLMARVTGNFERGNERLASQHPRNRQPR